MASDDMRERAIAWFMASGIDPTEDGSRPSGEAILSLAALLREVQAETIERCAREADGWDFGATIARDIRALKQTSEAKAQLDPVIGGTDRSGVTPTSRPAEAPTESGLPSGTRDNGIDELWAESVRSNEDVHGPLQAIVTERHASNISRTAHVKPHKYIQQRVGGIGQCMVCGSDGIGDGNHTNGTGKEPSK